MDAEQGAIAPQVLKLENTEQRIGLIPSQGGCVAFWEVRRNDAWHRLWRPYSPPVGGRPIVGNLPLVPWSNRIGGGGITVNGTFHPMRANRPDVAFPLHGNGWMQTWTVDEHDDVSILLKLVSRRFHDYPYDYTAWQRYTIEGNVMTMRLEVQHDGASPMPYGLGWHPFISGGADRGEVLLQFKADGYWGSSPTGFPTEHHAALPDAWNYSSLKPLREAVGVDNNFTGWDGRMRMERPDIDLRIDWETSSSVSTDLCIFYVPQAAPFFCFEPVTHLTDAFNRPDVPGARMLAQGERLMLEVRQKLSRRTSG